MAITGTATITVQPTAFYNVLSNSPTDPKTCPINAMTVAAGGDERVAVVNGAVKIKINGHYDALSLTFALDASLLAGGAAGYNLAFILFGTPGNAGIFTNKYGNTTSSIVVTVVLGTAAAPNLGNWEFFIGIQKGAGAAGQVGIIDPPIENDA